MKKYSLFFLLITLICITSCSQVFEAGVSGRVVTTVGSSEQGAADVYVFSYTDKSAYEKDLARFRNGATSPSEGNYVPRNVTDANGVFTINKIVWESTNGMFGKTADVANLYLIFYHEDYMVCGCGPISVISGSTNASSVKQYIEQVRFPMPVFSSQINDGNNSVTTTADDNEYDNVRLILTDKDFKPYEGVGSVVYTHSEEHGVDNLTYSHGHFSGLGTGVKWNYPEGETSVNVNIVWDKNDNGKADTGDLFYTVPVSRTTTGIKPMITFKETDII